VAPEDRQQPRETETDQRCSGQALFAAVRSCLVSRGVPNDVSNQRLDGHIRMAASGPTQPPADVPQPVVCRVDGEYWLVRPKARVAGEVVAEGARRRKLVEITRSGGVWALRAAKWLRPQHLTTPRNVV
jgi:hypothetical protein